MNFKQYFTESDHFANSLEIEVIPDEDLLGDDVAKAWQITRHYPNSEYEEIWYLSLDRDGNYMLHDFEGDEILWRLEQVVKIVKNWELKHKLKDQGLSDEQSDTAVKI